MISKTLYSLFSLAVLALCVRPVFADTIVGSSVNGALYFGTNLATNEFASANGGSGTTALIGPGVEFTYSDSYNTDTANFSATGLRIADTVAVNAAPFTMVFTDPAFTGFSLLTDQSGFTYSFSGDVLTVNFAGTRTPGTYATTFGYPAVASTPEPSGALLLGTGAVALLLLRKIRPAAC